MRYKIQQIGNPASLSCLVSLCQILSDSDILCFALFICQGCFFRQLKQLWQIKHRGGVFTMLQNTDHGVHCIILEWEQDSLSPRFLTLTDYLQRFWSAQELWMPLCNKYKSKSGIHDDMFCIPALPYEILRAEVCWCWLWSLSVFSALQLDQSTQQHVFQVHFPDNSYSPCSAYLQRWVLKMQVCTVCTSLMYLLARHMLRVTLMRDHCCARVDGTQVLICDTCRWTERDKRFPCWQIKPCVVSQSVLRKLVHRHQTQTEKFTGHSNAKTISSVTDKNGILF